MSINDSSVRLSPGERGHFRPHGVFITALLFLTSTLTFAGSKPPLLIAYFVPSDRTPIPGYVDRLDRVMTEVRGFYRRGMEAAGYGPMTFDLARDKEGKLSVYVVRGKE